MATKLISYRRVEPALFQQALSFYRTQFVPQYPPFQCLGCQPCAKLDKQVLNCLEKYSLSWCAIENKTGEMVALKISNAVNIDEVPETTPTYEEYIESGWSKEFALAWLLEDAVFNEKQILKTFKKTVLVKLDDIVTHVDYRNKGIGGELFTRSLIDAAAQGYSFAGAVTTSYVSQKLLEKHGFRKIKEIEYARFLIKNEAVFKHMSKAHKSFCAMVGEFNRDGLILGLSGICDPSVQSST